MSLKTLQQQLGTALLTLDGHNTLNDEASWSAFTASPQGNHLAGVSREGLYLYEELLRGSIFSTFNSIFPYTARFFSNAQRVHLAEVYRRTYPNASFQLYHSMASFPEFLANIASNPAVTCRHDLEVLANQLPFLSELAWYEGVEVIVQSAPDALIPASFEPGIPDAIEELGQWKPVWNDPRHLKTLTYPIPELLAQMDETEDEQLDIFSSFKPAPSDLLIYRDPQTLRARFFRLTPLTSAFISTSEKASSYLETLETLQKTLPELASIPHDKLLAEGLKLINQCHHLGILSGSLPAKAP